VQALQLAKQESEDAPIEQAVVQVPGERVSLTVVNPIGGLQELCQSQHRNLPVYEFEVLASGFRCTVTALGLSAVGEGPAKKMAKTEAAKGLLERLAEGG
jgi:dsRNA-specific ribonuclease